MKEKIRNDLKPMLEFRADEDTHERLLRIFEYLLQHSGVEKRYLTVDELSTYISTPKGTIYSWTHMQKIPHTKMGKGVRFDKVEIDKWMKKKKIKVFDYRQHLGI